MSKTNMASTLLGRQMIAHCIITFDTYIHHTKTLYYGNIKKREKDNPVFNVCVADVNAGRLKFTIKFTNLPTSKILYDQ